jgi:hypothetical protein
LWSQSTLSTSQPPVVIARCDFGAVPAIRIGRD